MKILQININYKIGSTGRIVYELHNKITESGLESYVAYGRSRKENKNTIKIGNQIDIYAHILGTRLFDMHGLFSRKATELFLKEIDKLKIDIFHLHNIHGYYIHYPTLFEYLEDKRIVWTLHDCWAFTGHCAYYDYIGCNKWQIGCNKCPQKTSYPSSYLFDNSRGNFHLKKRYFTKLKNLTIVTPSHWLADQVNKSFLRKYRVKTIHNGVNLSTFFPKEGSYFRRKYGLGNKFLILGIANFWTRRKGLEYFIKLSKIIGEDVRIVLVGLSKLQSRNIPKNKIVVIGRINNNSELADIYSSVDVFFNPTLEDNFPSTNLESLACGTPVITFDTGGSAESINNKCGYVVRRGDLKGAYAKISKIKQEGKQKYFTYCIRRSKEFDKDHLYIQYIKLYKSIYRGE